MSLALWPVVDAVAIGIASGEVATEHSVVLRPIASITRDHRRCNYITISITVAVPVNNTRALRYVIVMMQDTTWRHHKKRYIREDVIRHSCFFLRPDVLLTCVCLRSCWQRYISPSGPRYDRGRRMQRLGEPTCDDTTSWVETSTAACQCKRLIVGGDIDTSSLAILFCVVGAAGRNIVLLMFQSTHFIVYSLWLVRKIMEKKSAFLACMSWILWHSPKEI